MAHVKYRVREYIPQGNMPGVHSIYAEAVVDNIITNRELAKKVEARGISRAAEIRMILEEVANVILEECAENNRVQLETSEGRSLVSFYPKVQGSISDAEVLADPAKYGGASIATTAMLTPDRLRWTLAATVGIGYSRQFDMNKSAQKVDFNPNQTTADPDGTTVPTDPVNPGTNTGTNTGDNTGSDGGNNGGSTDSNGMDTD